MVEDNLRFLEGENVEEYDTNQIMVGMKSLFRGYVVKVWKGANFSSKKYYCLNKILVRHCVNYYKTCWDHRNEILYDEVKQKERATEWYEKMKDQIENNEPMQVKLFACRNKIDVARAKSGEVLQWIYNVKKIIKEVGKLPKNDIRRYFEN